jgi:integrase/recombinase XerC
MNMPDTSLVVKEVDDFLGELETVRQLSEHTLKAYRHDLQKLCAFIAEQNLDLYSVQSMHTRQWAAKLHGQGLSPRSLARILSAWRGFYEWLILQKSIKDKAPTLSNPLLDIRPPKRAKNLPKALSVEHVQVLIEFAQKEVDLELKNKPAIAIADRFALRDLALFELFYSSGLRLSEILGIDIEQSMSSTHSSLGWLDWDGDEVNVLGKGGKRRVVPVGRHAMQALVAWRNVLLTTMQSQAKASGGAALFVNEKLNRLSPRTVQARLKSLALRSGLPTHVHPHMLRHSFASHVLQSSHDLRAVQEMLGHASIGSTQIYTALDFQHLAQAYDLAHPRAKTK